MSESTSYWLQEKNGIYHVRFYINGIERTRSTRTTKINVAHRRAPKIIEQVVRELKGQKVLTFGHLVVRYYQHARLNKKSHRDDRFMLNMFLKYFKKEMVLDEFNPMKIEEFKIWLSYKKVAKDQTISNSRINRHLSVLQRMFNLAIEWEIFDRSNPVRKSHFLKEPPARDMIFSGEEIQRLWTASVELAQKSRTMNQKIFPAFLLTALVTGCRMGELIHLKVPDYQDGFFIIHKAKSNKKRMVPVRDELVQLLMRLPRKDEFIFSLSRRNSDVLRKTWHTVKQNAGIKKEARFHDLRHTHVSLLLQSGADIKTVQEIGGWSDLKMVERYAHTNAPLKTAAVTRIPLPDLSDYEI